jgi:EmrB/QacA subfamily drug resistance transporter
MQSASIPSATRLFAVLVPAGLLALLSTTVTGIALPSILRDQNGTVAAGQWITTGYMLAVALAIPLAGWAGLRYGLRRTWLWAMALFSIGSLAAAFAPDLSWLIAARIIQGLGGGALEPLMVTALAAASPPERMGRTMGAMGVVMEAGPLAGPTIGGAVVAVFGWHWIFALFALVTTFTLAAGAIVLEPVEGKRLPLDWGGLALLSAGNLFGLAGLARAATPAGFDMPVIAALLISLSAFIIFGVRSRAMGNEALIDIAALSRPSVVPSVAIMTLLGATIFPLFFGLPQFYQNVLGFTPLAAGLLMVPYGIGTLTAMPVMGRLSDRMPARVIVISGAMLSLLAFSTLFFAGVALGIWVFVPLSFATGLGLGSIASPTVATLYRALPENLAPSASTVLFTVLQIGGAFGVALLVLLIGPESWTAGTWPFLVPMGAAAVVALIATRLR